MLNYSICKCYCHDGILIKHVMPCCAQCVYCGASIRMEYFDRHRKECYLNPIKIEETRDDPQPINKPSEHSKKKEEGDNLIEFGPYCIVRKLSISGRPRLKDIIIEPSGRLQIYETKEEAEEAANLLDDDYEIHVIAVIVMSS